MWVSDYLHRLTGPRGEGGMKQASVIQMNFQIMCGSNKNTRRWDFRVKPNLFNSSELDGLASACLRRIGSEVTVLFTIIRRPGLSCMCLILLLDWWIFDTTRKAGKICRREGNEREGLLGDGGGGLYGMMPKGCGLDILNRLHSTTQVPSSYQFDHIGPALTKHAWLKEDYNS